MQILGIIGPWQIILILIILLCLLLPIIALIDILWNEFTGSNKIVWILVVILLPILGSVLYFIIGGQQKIKSGKIEFADAPLFVLIHFMFLSPPLVVFINDSNS